MDFKVPKKSIYEIIFLRLSLCYKRLTFFYLCFFTSRIYLAIAFVMIFSEYLKFLENAWKHFLSRLNTSNFFRNLRSQSCKNKTAKFTLKFTVLACIFLPKRIVFRDSKANCGCAVCK